MRRALFFWFFALFCWIFGGCYDESLGMFEDGDLGEFEDGDGNIMHTEEKHEQWLSQHEGEDSETSKEKKELLENHHKLDIGEPLFNAIKLAYVTPWNNHGYDVVKWAAKKFTHISPVWFNVAVVDDNANAIRCIITGQHDIDRGWMEDILKNNSAINFLPRFLFNQFTKTSLEKFLTIEMNQQLCLNELLAFIDSNDFHGAVLELWLQLMSNTHGTGEPFLIEMLEAWKEAFDKAKFILVLPLTPPLDEEGKENGIVSAKSLERLPHAAHFINLMAYDYPRAGISPVAPLEWAKWNVEYLIENGVQPSSIIFGMNWYGYDRTAGNSKAILGTDFLNYLKTPHSKLEYDEDAEEHYVTWGENKIAYYPTLKSIQTRLAFCDEMELAGIGIWDIGQGLDYFTSLL